MVIFLLQLSISFIFFCIKGEHGDEGSICVSGQAHTPAHVIECTEVLTSSEGGTLKSSVP